MYIASSGEGARWPVSSVAMFRCVLQCKHVTPLRGDMRHYLFRSVSTFNMRAASGVCPICVL